jgi:hypothetical protein
MHQGYRQPTRGVMFAPAACPLCEGILSKPYSSPPGSIGAVQSRSHLFPMLATQQLLAEHGVIAILTEARGPNHLPLTAHDCTT